MTVLISKPAFNLRESLNSLKREIGLKGAEIMRADTIDDVYNVIGNNRNMLINGGFDVWQRGTVRTNMPSGTYYSADRWHGYSEVSGRTYSQDTTEALSIGFKSCLKAINSTVSPSFYQKIEDVRTAAGKYVTLSFWIKADKTHKPTPQKIEQYFGSGGSASVAVSVPVIEITTEWKKFTITVMLPSVAGKTIGDGSYILVYPFTMDPSTTYWTTGWQFELGSVATPFEHRPYAEELALCQRYYEVGEIAFPGSLSICSGMFTVQKRASPTMTRISNVYSGAEAGTFVPLSSIAYYVHTPSTWGGGRFTAEAEL